MRTVIHLTQVVAGIMAVVAVLELLLTYLWILLWIGSMTSKLFFLLFSHFLILLFSLNVTCIFYF